MFIKIKAHILMDLDLNGLFGWKMSILKFRKPSFFSVNLVAATEKSSKLSHRSEHWTNIYGERSYYQV